MRLRRSLRQLFPVLREHETGKPSSVRPEFSVAGRTVLVTGAASGMGLLHARRAAAAGAADLILCCLLYTSPSPRDRTRSRMPSSA